MDKSQVAEYFEVDSDAVVKVREEDEGATICALIDYGIGGIKKYRIPVESFAPPKPATVSLPVAYDMNERTMSYRELQDEARAHGIPANWSAAAIRAALEEEE